MFCNYSKLVFTHLLFVFTPIGYIRQAFDLLKYYSKKNTMSSWTMTMNS